MAVTAALLLACSNSGSENPYVADGPSHTAHRPTLEAPIAEELSHLADAEQIPVAEAQRRNDWRQLLQPAIKAIDADSNNFGGRALHDSGGTWRLEIYYLGDNSFREAIAALLPDGAPVEWTRVKYSYATLERTRESLRDLANGLGRLAFNYIRTDVFHNHVTASVRPGEEELAESLREHYPPDLVEVVIESERPRAFP